MRKRKEKQKGRKRKERRNKEKIICRKMREEERERKYFLGFGRSTFDSLSTKVGARSGIYVWTTKSWSFDKLQEVGYFPTWFTFSLKAL